MGTPVGKIERTVRVREVDLDELGDTIKLMAQVDEAIDQHGGWPIK